MEAVGRGRPRPRVPATAVLCEGFCYCGACPRCRAGDTHLCEHYDCLGFTRGGGYGELVVVPRRVVHRLPDGRRRSTPPYWSSRPRWCCRACSRAQAAARARRSVSSGSARSARSRSCSPGSVLAVRRSIAYGIRDAELELARRLGADRDRRPLLAATPRSRGRARPRRRDRRVPSRPIELATRLARMGGRVVRPRHRRRGARAVRSRPTASSSATSTLLGSVGYTTAVLVRAWSNCWAPVVVDFSRRSLRSARPGRARFEDAFAADGRAATASSGGSCSSTGSRDPQGRLLSIVAGRSPEAVGRSAPCAESPESPLPPPRSPGSAQFSRPALRAHDRCTVCQRDC